MKTKSPTSAQKELYELQAEKLRLLSTKVDLVENLPHLYGKKLYKWQREYFETTNKDSFLCAANQIGKSSIQIKRLIHRATSPELWKTLYRRKPRVFWYLYPSKDICTEEFENKWIKEFLPRGKYQDDTQYGWRAIYKTKFISAIKFNSGITLYYKTYSQDVHKLQAGTVDEIATDEELVADLYDELNFRRMATDGYFSMAFTATRGQQLWKDTIEPGEPSKEKFPHAFKRQISMWDCQEFEDGTKSHWTDEKILKAIASCKSEAEVQRRVYGRFVMDSGLKYPGFERAKNFRGGGDVPANWLWYGAADIGSGGDDNHPAAITFVAVSPDFKKGRVVRVWRGDGVVTTASDVLDKFIEMRAGREFTGQFYDWHSKDFLTIAQRRGESFLPAEKGQEIGQQIMNALFKTGMLMIDEAPDNMPLVEELTTLQVETDKKKAVDDAIDSCRYTVTRIPWDWSAVGLNFTSPGDMVKPEQKTDRQVLLEEWRKQEAKSADPSFDASLDVNAEIATWNEFYDP